MASAPAITQAKARFDRWKAAGKTAVQARALAQAEIIAYRRNKKYAWSVEKYLSTQS